MKKFAFLFWTLNLFIFTTLLSLNASSQLTGAWKDNNGNVYCMRQIGNNLFWYVDMRPNVHNVFYGMIAGNTITGNWADLPGGQKEGNGFMSLRIDSYNQLTKIDQSGNYRESMWYRSDNIDCVSSGQTIPTTGVSGSLTGVWSWTAECCTGGTATSELEITTQNRDGTFSGKFLGTAHVGTVDGQICGDQIYFVRTIGGGHIQKWYGKIIEIYGNNATKIEGSLSSNQHKACEFNMTKK